MPTSHSLAARPAAPLFRRIAIDSAESGSVDAGICVVRLPSWTLLAALYGLAAAAGLIYCAAVDGSTHAARTGRTAVAVAVATVAVAASGVTAARP